MIAAALARLRHADPGATPQHTHHGPHGFVRACRWYGNAYDAAYGFLRSAGSVAYRTEGFGPARRLVVDTDGYGEETAYPGDWLVWQGGQLRVVGAGAFRVWYRPVGVRP